MHALITGHPPWTGSDLPDILAKTLSSQTPPPIADAAVEIPRELHRLIPNCLSKEPSARPASMIEVRENLQLIFHQANLPFTEVVPTEESESGAPSLRKPSEVSS